MTDGQGQLLTFKKAAPLLLKSSTVSPPPFKVDTGQSQSKMATSMCLINPWQCTDSCKNDIGDICTSHEAQGNFEDKLTIFLSSFVPKELSTNSFRGSEGSEEQRNFFSSTSSFLKEERKFLDFLFLRKSHLTTAAFS